jgi:type IV pilus assembly protein PilC
LLGEVETIWFFKQVRYLLNSGMSLYPTLQVIYSDSEDIVLRDILKGILAGLKEGNSFSDVLRKKLKINFFIANIIKVGEHKGTLDYSLDKVISYLHRKQELKKKIINALSYPLLLFIMSFFILMWVNIVIVPNFYEVYSQANIRLPLPTLILFYSNKFISNYGLFIIGAIAFLFVVFLILYKKKLKLFFDKLQFNIFIYGRIYYLFSVIIFLSNLGTLQQSGITVIKSLKLSIDATNNMYFRRKLEKVYSQVLEGTKLSKALEKTQFFPNMVIEILATGEEASALGEVCGSISEHLDSEMETKISQIVTLIGPISLIIIGGFVAFISLSFLLPLFRMTSIVNA